MLPADRANLTEVVARSRRIETRLTRFLEAQGLETGIQRPYFHDGRIVLPTPAVTVDALVQVYPRNWDPGKPIDVVLAESGELVCRITLL